MTNETIMLDLTSAAPLLSQKIMLRIPGTDKPSGWVIELAGPAHEQTVALNNLSAREVIEKEKAIEATQVNGRKWKTDDETVADRRRRNVNRVCRRIIGWDPNPTFQQVSAEPIKFSLEAATDLFLRPELGGFFVQVTDYLNGERAFLQPSEQT